MRDREKQTAKKIAAALLFGDGKLLELDKSNANLTK